jgi:pimeloyl-ACP methyl ester carboxylesterase
MTPIRLLLLHGLGATGDVWEGCRPYLDERWPGEWAAPDLPGHGRADPLPRYTFDTMAAAVAERVPLSDDVVVLGHSLGGVVGLALPHPVRAVVGLGIKAVWTSDELARAAALAQRPVTWFDTRAEAAARYVRVAGLDGLLSTADPAVDAGLSEVDGRWRLAMDPATFGVGAPELAQRLTTTRAEVLLARGELDAMNTDEQLAALGVPTATLPGLGHNAHVQDPAAVLALLQLSRET